MGRASIICAAAVLAATVAAAPAARAQSSGAESALGSAIVGGIISNAIKRQNGAQQADPQQTRSGATDRQSVRQDQTDLNALGFDTGRPDGAAGPRTRRAYAAFQASVGLPETGIVTAQERMILRAAAARVAAGDSRDFALGYAAASAESRTNRSNQAFGGQQTAATGSGRDALIAGLLGGAVQVQRSGGTSGTAAPQPVTVTASAPAPQVAVVPAAPQVAVAAPTSPVAVAAPAAPQVTVAPAAVAVPPPPPVAGAAPQLDVVAPATGPAIPSRRFSGPGQYPPTDYRGYGVLAFKSQQTSYDALRHQIICEAYLATMLPSRVIAAPKVDQFVTIWPVESVENADSLNASDAPLSPLCRDALGAYDLPTAAEAIRKARMAGFEDGGVGPFLLGWLPGDGFGSSDALILSLDLSLVASYAQAQSLFTEWKRDIESDPALLERGFSLELVRRKIRRWADRHGPGFLALWKG